jgi:hypothetical protein
MMMFARVCVAVGVLASCHRDESPVKTERPQAEEVPPVVPPRADPPAPAPQEALRLRIASEIITAVAPNALTATNGPAMRSTKPPTVWNVAPVVR